MAFSGGPQLGGGGFSFLSPFNPTAIVAGLGVGIADLITGGPGKRSEAQLLQKQIDQTVSIFEAQAAGTPQSIFDNPLGASTLDEAASLTGQSVDSLLGLIPARLPDGSTVNLNPRAPASLFEQFAGSLQRGGFLPALPPPATPTPTPTSGSVRTGGSSVPFVPSSLGFLSGPGTGTQPIQSSGFDFAGLLDVGLAALPGILGAFGVGQPSAAPGGAPLPQFQPQQPGGLMANVSTTLGALGFGIPGGDLVPTGVGNLQSAACITPRMTGSVRLPSRVDVPTVDASGNQRFTTFKNMGRPLLWSGDLAAAKRVRKVAAKARRRVGGR